MFFIVSPQRLSTKCHFYACPSPGGSFFESVGTLPAVGPVWVLCHEVSPVHTAIRNCTRDEGGPFEVGNQVLISSRRKLLRRAYSARGFERYPRWVRFAPDSDRNADIAAGPRR